MFGHPVPENIQNSHGSSSWPDRLFPPVPVSTASHLHACVPYTTSSSSTYRWFRGVCVVPRVAWSRCGNSKCSCSSGCTAPTTRQSICLICSITVFYYPFLTFCLISHIKVMSLYVIICCVSGIPPLLIFVCLNHTYETSIIIFKYSAFYVLRISIYPYICWYCLAC